MKKFYKICVCLLVWTLVSALSFSSARLPIWIKEDPTPEITDPKVKWQNITGTIAEWSKKWTQKLEWILEFPERTDYATPLGYALRLVQISINRILWILAFVALVYMLYSWFLLFSSWTSDNNAKKGKKWISTAAIALAWIGLSWLIVSAMIWFITLLTKAS